MGVVLEEAQGYRPHRTGAGTFSGQDIKYDYANQRQRTRGTLNQQNCMCSQQGLKSSAIWDE